MRNGLRSVLATCARVRQLIVRAELALSAVQVAFWVAVVVAAVGGVLLVRRRLIVGHTSAESIESRGGANPG